MAVVAVHSQGPNVDPSSACSRSNKMTRIPRRSTGIVVWAWVLFPLFKRVVAAANILAPSNEQSQFGSARTLAPDAASHIVGGSDALPGRYPYIANLYSRRGELLCGGSLIAPDMVLAAAHCAYDFDTIEIGRHDRENADDNFETFRVRHYEVYPLYTYTYELDFLLVQLDGISTFQPIRLNRDDAVPFVGEELTAMGFGSTTTNGRTFPAVLQEASVFTISNQDCESRKDAFSSYEGQISQDSLCASAQGRDACGGDSGAPLIQRNGDSAADDLQVGVVLWGRGCASSVFPGVYGRVAYVSEWIDEIVCERSTDPPDDFGCTSDRPVDPPTLPSTTQIPVTVVLRMDTYPNETWWVMEDSFHNTIAGSLVGFYDQPGREVRDVVWLNTGQVYTFIIRDIYGDGMCCTYGEGSYAVYLGEASSTSIPLEQNDLLVSGSGKFGLESRHVFQMPPRLSVNPSYAAVLLTIVLQFDRYPEEIGWSLTRLGDAEEQRIFRDTGTFSEDSKNGQVIETVWVEEGALYNFTMFDRHADGLCCQYGNGSYRLLLGTRDVSDESAIVVNGAGSFETSKSEIFLVDASLPESSSFVTFEILFDQAPTEISWVLEMEVPPTAIAAQRQDNQGGHLYAIAYGSSYSRTLAGQVITEKHPLPLIPESPPRKFIFTFMDSGGNGLCCENGSGLYRLYYGAKGKSAPLVIDDGGNSDRDRTEFFLAGTDPPSAAPNRATVSLAATLSMLSVVALHYFVLT